jgi:methionyl-tRNA formyltransferase
MNAQTYALRKHGRAGALLIGDGPTALTALRSLAASCRVIGVVRAAEIGGDDPVRIEAANRDVPVWTADGVSDLVNLVASLKPDAVVISSYNRILPNHLLALSEFINVHYSPLPRYRGRANVNWAIINGERAAGISIHRITPELDDGNILFQAQIPISSTDTAQTVYARLNEIQEAELGSAVLRALAGDPGRPQDGGSATYGCGRVPDDGEITWSASSASIDCLIRALAPPFPGAFTHVRTRKLFVISAKILEAPLRFEGRVPGRVVNRSSRGGWVDVLTGDGCLRLVTVAVEEGETLAAADLIRSTRTTLGLSRLDLLCSIGTLTERISRLEAIVRSIDHQQDAPQPIPPPGWSSDKLAQTTTDANVLKRPNS